MKIVLQDGNKDCGVCSLLSIIRFYGGDVSKEYLREITNTTKSGVSAYKLIEGAIKLGFDCEGVSGDMTNLENNNLPCIAHLAISKTYKHFVVIYKIDKITQKIVIMDPAKGKRVMSFSEFKLHSTNNFILLRPIKKIPIISKKKVIIKTIKEYLKQNKKLFLLLLIFISLYFLFNIVVAFHFKYLLEFSINYKVDINIITISLCIFIIYLYRGLCDLFKNILFLKISSVLDEKITIKTYRQILLLPYLYYKNRTTGEVITRLKDLSTVKNFIIQIFSCSIDFISLIIFLVLLFTIDIKITLFVITLSFILTIFILFRNNKKRKLYGNVCNYEEKVNSYLIESLNSVDTIKGGHVEKRLADKFLINYKNLLEKSYLYMFFLSINKIVKDGIKDILLVIVYGVGSYLVIKKKIDLGDILLYQSFLLYFLNNLYSIINVIDEYYSYKISLNRVEDLYTISGDNFNGSYYYYNYVLDKDIVFKNLIYKYSSKVLFNSLNLTIKYGEKVLLIGESGSGKSSLVKILMRYLEVPYGMCSIGGIDINHYHLENIRKNISYVSSNEFLFSDTLYNNLTLGKDVNDNELSKICRITRVDEILKRRGETYKMLVEENGFNFSNGERQRIILCRYLLRNSNIYIFDEAFGQLDVSNEKKILFDMFKYLKNKTVIVISHRLYNKNLFNRVLKIKDGKIYEEKV